MHSKTLQKIVKVLEKMDWEKISLTPEGGFIIIRDCTREQLIRLYNVGFYVNPNIHQKRMKLRLDLSMNLA